MEKQIGLSSSSAASKNADFGGLVSYLCQGLCIGCDGIIRARLGYFVVQNTPNGVLVNLCLPHVKDEDGNNDKMDEYISDLDLEKRIQELLMQIKRRNNFVFMNRVNGRSVNVFQGIQLNEYVFNMEEQKRLVDYIFDVHQISRRYKVKQFTTNADSEHGEKPSMLKFSNGDNNDRERILINGQVNKTPRILEALVNRLVACKILQPGCDPNRCIIQIYGPRHRYFSLDYSIEAICAISLLSECKLVVPQKDNFCQGTLPLPPGSVMLLAGQGKKLGAINCVPCETAKKGVLMTLGWLRKPKARKRKARKPKARKQKEVQEDKDGVEVADDVVTVSDLEFLLEEDDFPPLGAPISKGPRSARKRL